MRKVDVGTPSPQPGDCISMGEAGQSLDTSLGEGTDRGAELWSSKALNLVWLPRCDNWHSPCMLSAALPNAIYSENPPDTTSNCEWIWFWRVDPSFGAWVVRTIHRAGQAKADLPQAIIGLFNVLKEYLTTNFPGCWIKVENRAKSGPVILPGSEIIPCAAEFARYGMVPRWDGWMKALRDHGDPVSPDVPPPASATRPSPRPRPPATRQRSPDDEATPKLF